MPMRSGYWIECDDCGNGTGDAGIAIPAPESTPDRAIDNTPEDWLIDLNPTPARFLCPDCLEADPDTL
ncbi:hypothetical protein [Nocardia farcinica]|uniref:hypothetical protein n=1 Tax=Nocardia farcinica TaxID=37329 RepID=UPI002456AC84|nr:hypothetical protein [Nocardia farcinica]